MMTEYKCPKCRQPYFNFKELCSHVQHDHGLFYLGREKISYSRSPESRNTMLTSRTDPQNCHPYCHKTMTELGEIKQHLQMEVSTLKQQNNSLLIELRSLKLLPTIAGGTALLSDRIPVLPQSPQSSCQFRTDSQSHLNTNNVNNNNTFEILRDLKDGVMSEVNFLNQSYRELQREFQSLKLSLNAVERDGTGKDDNSTKAQKRSSVVSSQTGSVVADSGKGGSYALSEEIAPITDVTTTPFESPVKSVQRQTLPINKTNVFRNKRTLPENNAIPEGVEEDRPLDAIFQLVFHYLPTDDLLACRNVCQRWRRWLSNPKYWISFTFIHRNVTSRLLKDVSSCCTEMRFLTLQGLKCSGINESVDLNVSKNSLRCLWLIGCHCPQVRQLAYISDCHPVTPEALWSLGAGCRKLHTLIIPPLHPCFHPKRFNDRCLIMIGKCWALLRTVCIGGTGITAAGLIDLVSSCLFLEALELDHMGEVQESVMKLLCEKGLKELQHIYLTHTPIMPNAVQILSETCPNLAKISILISPEDYFLHPESVKNKEKFRQKLQALKILKKDRILRNVLIIEETTAR